MSCAGWIRPATLPQPSAARHDPSTHPCPTRVWRATLRCEHAHAPSMSSSPMIAGLCRPLPTLQNTHCNGARGVSLAGGGRSQLMGNPDAWFLTGTGRFRAQPVHRGLARAGQGCWREGRRLELGGGWAGGWARCDGMDDGTSLLRVRGQRCAFREVGSLA